MTIPNEDSAVRPITPVSVRADELATRVQLIDRYNFLVSEPGKITITIQTQFLMGFKSNDEIASLRSVYPCLGEVLESAIRLHFSDDA